MKKWLRISLLLFVLNAGMQGLVRAQSLSLELVSISPSDTIGIDDSLSIVAHIFNTSTDTTGIPAALISFRATYKGTLLTNANFFNTPLSGFLFPGDTITVYFNLYQNSSAPLPQISPGGGAVVIWPVYLNHTVTDSVSFTLYYFDLPIVNTLRLRYTHGLVEIYLPDQEVWEMDLYNLSGQKLAGQTTFISGVFDINGLQAGVYIIAARKGKEVRGVKFIHY